MREQRTAQLPLKRYAEIIGYSPVDEADYERLKHYRWYKTGQGYVARVIKKNGKQQTVFLHREILGLVAGDGLQVDHINGDPLDNRRSNLRIVTASGNAQNRRTTRHKARTSRFRGVSWVGYKDGGKWMARVTPPNNGRRAVYLGVFDDEETAAQVASEYRLRHMPFTVETREDIR